MSTEQARLYRDGQRHWVVSETPTRTLTPDRYLNVTSLPSAEEIRTLCRLALHDGICPEGEECRSRELHSQASVYYLQWSSIADAMIRRLGAGG